MLDCAQVETVVYAIRQYHNAHCQWMAMLYDTQYCKCQYCELDYSICTEQNDMSEWLK